MNSMILASAKACTSIPSVCGDDELLARMQDDDSEAYRVLVARHIDRAYGLALRVLKSPADAEDVTQDAFVKAWLHRHSWQAGRAKFSTWLYRVIVNRCIDLRRMPRNEWLDDVQEPADESDDSITLIHRRQVYGQLEAALARLPDQQRAAVALSYYDDLGNAEIAEVLDTTVSAVESLLKRGRQRLRELLKRSERDIRHVLEER